MPFRRCAPQPLEDFVRKIFRSLGADEDIAGEAARHLVRANLSGHDSHGIIRVMQYVAQTDAGEMQPAARPVIAREMPAAALIDARRSMGLYSTVFALDWAMDRARTTGAAVAAVRHSTHIGRVGEYAERAAERGFVAIVTVGAAGPGVGGMVPHRSRMRFFGANPYSIGVPADPASPMIFDGSTSTIAEGKVRVARAEGKPVPRDAIIDKEGRPTTDPEDFYAGGALVPLGGEAAGHKGYGLAFASALLGSLAMIDDPNPTMIGASVREDVPDPRGRIAGVFLAVVDPASLGEAAHYRAMAAETLAAVKRVPPAGGAGELLIPGEPERRNREQRGRDGILIAETTWQDLAGIADRFRVPMPDAPLETR